MAESEEELKSLLKKVKEESEKSWLKTQHSKNEDHGLLAHHFMTNRWGETTTEKTMKTSRAEAIGSVAKITIRKREQDDKCEKPEKEYICVYRLPGETSITSDMQMTPPLWQKVKRNSKAS